ncbi:hypothetical protein Tco_0110444 [Tanacetum coccineum]
MSNHKQPTPSHPKSDVRNTAGKNKQTPQGSVRTTSAVDLEEFCEKHYEKLLPIMADKYEYEKRKKEKLEEVKAMLDFGDARKKSTRALRRERSRSPRHEYKSKARRESTMFKRLGSRGRSTSAHSDSRRESSRSSVEDDDLSQPWVCAETDPFTSRIRHFDFPKTRMPSHVKTYNGSEDPEDHLKIFQAAAKTERINRQLQRSKRSIPEKLPLTEKVHQRPHSAPQHQAKRRRVHRRLHTKVATSFLQGQEAASNQERKKVPQAWRHQEGGHRQNFKKGGGFRNQHKTEKRPDRFTLLTKTPKEILALEKRKFKTPPPMTTPVEK